MNLQSFTNSFHHSTTYTIELAPNNWVVVDPGWMPHQLEQWMNETQAVINAIFLTHEHADHCAGVNRLVAQTQAPLFCTADCKTGIANSKHNFSAYIDEVATFEIKTPCTVVNDGEKVKLGEYDFTFISTPGHSPGSTCIQFSNYLLTGDTLMPHAKTPLNFPRSNRAAYKESINKLKNYIARGIHILPGHGEAFGFESWEQLSI
ncbi:MBL fold metallo-hydrolase [Mariniphaga sediminis]|uniref:MBL fold metallo-hydrolase n=1 Tax=Mariniphaga sediminis TaxID=1628158 RepID=UPI0035665D0A